MTPTLAPTPTLDPSHRLLVTFADPKFAARVTIVGSESVPSGSWVLDASGSPVPLPGPSTAPLVLRYEGEAYVSGRDYLLRMQVVDQEKLVFGELRTGRSVWRRTFSHPWQSMPTADDATAPKLFALLAALPALEPVGETTSGGETLLRYRAPASTALSLITIFLQEEAVKDPDVGTVEIEARADGTPVHATVRMTSDDLDYSEVMPQGMTIPPRTYEFTYTFTAVDSVVLPDPVEPVTSFQSRLGVSFEYPSEWTIGATDAGAEMIRGRANIFVTRWWAKDFGGAPTDPAELLQAFTAWAIEDLTTHDMTLESIETTTVGGLPAYLFAVRTKPGASEAVFRLEATLVAGSALYSIFWIADPGTELRDRYDFERLLASVKLAP